MSLDAAVGAASSGLDSVSRRLSVISQNVANANTAGYVRETVSVTSDGAAGQGLGVRTGVASRSVDGVLQSELFAVGGHVASGQVRADAFAAIDVASGAPGSGQDLAGLVGNVRDAFSLLGNDPSNQTQQRAVVSAAASLAAGLNGLSGAVTSARQTAQDGLVDDVARANTALRSLGTLSDQIIAGRASGTGTADLEDKRDAVIQTVTELTGAQVLKQANGDVLAISGGTVLSTRAATGPLSIGVATLAADTPTSAVPPLLVNGTPAPIGGGRIGAELDLRDNAMPSLQSGLDGFAQSLAAGFSAAGLDLFSDASGSVPTGAGFAGSIQVNPAVQATPSMVRDGTGPAGAAGSLTLVNAVLGTVLGSGAGTIAAQASTLVASNAGLASAASRALATDQAVQTSLQAKMTSTTGVSVDTEMTEMVQLQNSYGANAKVITAVQAMWTQLLDAVR